MKRMLGTALTTLVLVVATASPSNAAPRDFASGSGKINFGGTLGHVNFTGHGTPTEANGQIRFDLENSPFESVEATVDCVSVTANRAAISGTLRKPSGVFTHILIYVEDNGQPQDGTDRATGIMTNAPIPCAGTENVLTGDPVEQGNVIVRDSSAP
jgi:hypothetical protein